MPIDASIYGQIQQPEDPISKYAKLAQIKNMQGQGRLQELQATGLQTKLDEEQAVKKAFGNLQPGQDISSILPDVLRASPSQGLALQKSALENKNVTSQINERKIPALAGSFAMVLKAPSPTDDVVNQAGNAYTAATGESHDQITNHILSLPLEQRKQFILSTAATNPTGQAALKLIYPDVETKDLLGTTTVKTPLSGVTKQPVGVTDASKGLDVIESGAQALSDYSGPVPSSFALKSPLIQAQMARAKQINPDYDIATHQQVIKAIHDFGTGKQGNTVRSFNVALAHLDTLGNLADALQNNDVQLVNRFANAAASQTGNPAPTSFDAAKKIVGDEIVKAIVGSGGGVTDREEASKTVDKANSPAQLKAVIKTYKDLMVGQLGGLEQQYQASTKRNDFESKYLSPDSQNLYSSYKNPKTSGGGTPASNQQIEDLLKKYGSR